MDCKLVQSFSATEDITITATVVGDTITTMAIMMAVGIRAAGILAGMTAEEDIQAADMTGVAEVEAVEAAMVVEEEVADFGQYRRHQLLVKALPAFAESQRNAAK